MMPRSAQSLGRSLASALTACLALASCAVPPPDAYIGSSHTSEVLDLGANPAHETCSLQRGGTDSQIYCGSYLEPAGRVVTPEQAADPAAFVTSSAWRTVFDSRFLCGAPSHAMVLDSPAATLSCTRRQGGWPQVVLAVRIGGTLYVAEGVKPVESILPQAIGVMSGRLPAVPAAAVDASGLATQRQAAQAVNIDGAGAIAEIEQQTSRGALENRRGNFAAAESAYRAAASIQERLVGPDNPALAVPLARQALQVSNQGRFAEADQLFGRAERLVALPDQIDPVARPLVAHLKALDQINRNKPREALALLDEAERGFTAIVPPALLVPRTRTTSVARSKVEQMADAADDSSLLADQSSSDALNGLIEAHRYRAIALKALGRPQEAEAELAATRSLFVGRPARLVARYYRNVGVTASFAGNNASSLAELGRAVDVFARAQPASVPLARTQLLRAAGLTGQGDYTAAVSECRSAAEILRSLNTGVAPELLMPCLHALSTDVARGGQPVLVEMFALSQLAQGNITSQQIARATARLAEGARNPNVAEAIRASENASDRLEALYRERQIITDDKDATAALANINSEIHAAQDAERNAGQVLQAASPGYAGLVQKAVTASDVQETLLPNEALAEIVLGEDEGWTLLIRHDGISAGRIEGGSKRVDALVSRFRASMELRPDNTPAPFDTQAAHDLYTALLGPVSAGLAGADSLTVAPSGSLLAVPFGALLTESAPGPDLSQAQFLIRKMAVSHVPSVASFVNLRQGAKTVQATRPWFGMGDFEPPSLRQAIATFPVEACGESAREFVDLPLLAGARKELEVARLLLSADKNEQLLGPSFTAKNVIAAPLKNYRILHFATHALLPGELRCQAEPAIVTSTPPGAPDAAGGLLTASQIEQMDLDADLVILAACNTGGANGGGAGESLSGLARSFFFAGARSLLVTHWDANDTTTTYLTALFLQALRTDPNAGPAAALAVSQRRMLDESVGDRAAQAHPYYWAVEALIGGRGAVGPGKVAVSGSGHAGG
jgi:CHAT domain-containing protein